MKTITKSIKTELAPNIEQAQKLKLFCDARRRVYNWGNEYIRSKFFNSEKLPSKFDLQKEYTSVRLYLLDWCLDFPRTSMEFTFVGLDMSWKRYFYNLKRFNKQKVKIEDRKPKPPKFQSYKNRKQSFAYRGCKLKNNKVYITNLGWVNIKERNFSINPSRVWSATISYYIDRWYISVSFDEEIEDVCPCNEPIGIDLGLKNQVYCSDGVIFENPKILNKYEKKLKRINREMSRRIEGSSNWNKTKIILSKLYRRVKNTREWHTHNITHSVVIKQPEAIVIEDLAINNMVKNKHLSKSLYDAAFGMLKRQLIYKAEWSNITLLQADRWFASTKICSTCGNKKEIMTLSERRYACEICGLEIDRDLNASINLKNLLKQNIEYVAGKSPETINACGDYRVTDNCEAGILMRMELS